MFKRRKEKRRKGEKEKGFLLFSLLLFSFLPFSLFLSCNNPPATGVIQTSTIITEDTNPFILGNQKILELENEDIELFLKRYQWNMTQTNTGLRYETTRKGTGANISIGETVTLEYRTYLLSGKEIYNSKDDGKKQFMVEKSEEIAGLHEAVQLMSGGAEARLIIPSHLAYGASGDGNRIKPYQTIIMKIKIMR
ncbi:MAG: FKBP-type peptidyl-prolyl cis-trans isomerase [Lentimicrobiaceae bacterium]|nr:FKBP-type peptidyl-prolyl cis-trans isomerase [Lentimicrobiaceae bacterium]